VLRAGLHACRWPKRDITLSWARFSEAAREAGASRLWGGIHIESDNREGARSGTCAARFALARASNSRVHALGLAWDDASGKNNGQYAPFSWRSA